PMYRGRERQSEIRDHLVPTAGSVVDVVAPIVRSGFGESDDWRHYVHNTARGWDEMVADLALYLETAVRGARHFSLRSGLGATMLQSAAGVRITYVVPGGFAARAGMQAGDVVLRLNGASVVHLTDVVFLGREHDPGE